MTDAIRRLGIAYGKLGLSTDPELIGRRSEGVKAAVDNLRSADIASLVLAAFDTGSGDARFDFLCHFENDPTFDVGPTDREAILLAGAVAEHKIENGKPTSPEVALAVLACACGGLRKSPFNDQLVEVAQRCLTRLQGQSTSKPKSRTYYKQPKTLLESIDAVTAHQSQYFTQTAPHVVAALKAVGEYAESVARNAANSDEEMLAYLGGVEQEMRVYWWVTGGWSDSAEQPFRQLPLALAAVCAGTELASKHSSPAGLFAAPALIDLILERGRSVPLGDVVLQDAVSAPAIGWRKRHFAELASKPLAALLPVTAALGSAAASEDAEDWKPRFKRLTGIEADSAIPATGLAVQLYRECLVARALG